MSRSKVVNMDEKKVQDVGSLSPVELGELLTSVPEGSHVPDDKLLSIVEAGVQEEQARRGGSRNSKPPEPSVGR